MSILSIKIGAVLDGNFNAVIKGSSGHLSRLGDNIKQLNSSLKSVTGFRQLGRDVLASKHSWKDFDRQAKTLAQKIKAAEKPSKELKAAFNQAKASATKTKNTFLKKREALHAMSKEIKNSGRTIKSFINDQYKLEASISRVRSQYNKLGSAIRKHQSFLASKSHFKSQMLETAALGITLAVPIKIAIDFESAMADIKAVVKFDDDKEINNKIVMELGQELKKLSREIPLSAAELAKIATSGGRLRFSKKEITQFTEAVAKMAVNFGMTAEEIGSSISKLSNIYGIGADKMKEFGDTLNHLASNTTVEAKGMMLAMTVAGGAAKQFGLTADQTAGLVNAFISLGKEPKKAAGVISDMLGKLQTVREQGDDFREALEEIGIDVEEFEENIKKDAQGTLLNLFETLEKIDKHERSDILLRLFGSGSQDDIALIVENLQKYKDVLGLLADKKKRENSLEEEFQDRANTTASKLQLLKNSIAEVCVNLGSVMLPALNFVAKYLKIAAEHVALFAEEFPTVTAVITGTIATLISLKILAVGAGYVLTLLASTAWSFAIKTITVFSLLSTYAIPAVVTGLSFLKGVTISLATTAFPLLSSAIPAVVTGIRFLTAAIVSNPIGAIIALLASGAILIISNWENVKSFFASFWEYIKSIIKPIGEAFAWLGDTVSSIFGGISENSPIKEFEKMESVVSLVDGRTANELSKNSVFSDGNSPLNSSVIKGLSESNLENFRIKSVMEEKGHTEENQDDLDKVFKEFMQKKFEAKEPQMLNRTQNITNNFTISIKTEPNQDVRSIANAVIERLREQARGALFDTIEEMH